MQRLLAILIAGALATTSFAATEACPTMRAHALKRCCCPPASQEHARLTCCAVTTGGDSRVVARDRQEQPKIDAAAAAAAWSFVCPAPALPVAAPRGSVLASAAGPPPLALRI